MPAPDRLAALDKGFRHGFLDHDTLTAQVRAWADAFPDLVRLRSLGESLEGRPLWHLTIGPDPDRIRPAVWIDGNMHASELCGSSVALAMAEDAIRLHLEPDQPIHGFPAHLRERLHKVLFYVLPRMSPDGAECVLTTARYVRSAPRDRRPNQQHPHWTPGDVDGDGLALLMRVVDPAGEFVESEVVPGLMLPRRIDDPPPYYRLYPEGTIEHFDGHHVPAPNFLTDNQTDLNRNFPYSWKSEPDQRGAGAFPGSEPESRAVMDFAVDHPEIFAWLNLHTFGGVFIRPLGDGPDSAMNQEDLAIYREIGAWSEDLTGYPMVSGFKEFLYQPDTPLYGDLSEYAYQHRGCLAYVVELWDLFAQLGMKRGQKFVDYYSHMTRDDLERLGTWDREHNHGRALRPWRRVTHPQLGAVEVGGIDPRVGLWNPPYERIDEILRGAEQRVLAGRGAGAGPAGHPAVARGGGRRHPSVAGGRQPGLPGHHRAAVGRAPAARRVAVGHRAYHRRLRPGRPGVGAPRPRPPRGLGAGPVRRRLVGGLRAEPRQLEPPRAHLRGARQGDPEPDHRVVPGGLDRAPRGDSDAAAALARGARRPRRAGPGAGGGGGPGCWPRRPPVARTTAAPATRWPARPSVRPCATSPGPSWPPPATT